MRIQTFSIVVGSPACDSSCPFCVSRMTGYDELPPSQPINTTNFRKAVKFAEKGDCTTVLFTGKGEPLLDAYLPEINEYLRLLKDCGNPFPFIEIQTNGIRIGRDAAAWLSSGVLCESALSCDLVDFHIMGLNTIAISCVGYKRAHNQQVYLSHRQKGLDQTRVYPDLDTTIRYLHKMKFTVRLCVMMHKGMVQTPADLEELVLWCKQNQVDQLTIRPIRAPDEKGDGESEEYFQYVKKYGLDRSDELEIQGWLDTLTSLGDAHHLMTLMNGANAANIYDVRGQNLCYSDCLTVEPVSDDIRTLIFFGDGRLTYNWAHPGARLL